MAQLYSQYASGTQFTAGTIVGSATGTSGVNAFVDRLNSISTDNNLLTGSIISGTSTNIITPHQATDTWLKNVSGATTVVNASDIITPFQTGNLFTGSVISGTNTILYVNNIFEPKLKEFQLGSGYISVSSGPNLHIVNTFKLPTTLGSLDLLKINYQFNHNWAADGGSIFVRLVNTNGSLDTFINSGSLIRIDSDIKIWSSINQGFTNLSEAAIRHRTSTSSGTSQTFANSNVMNIEDAGSLIFYASASNNSNPAEIIYRINVVKF